MPSSQVPAHVGVVRSLRRWSLVLCTLVAAASSHCALDERDPLVDSNALPNRPMAGGAGSSGLLSAAVTRSLGEQCAGASECESGFCTDGVCCAEACRDLCATCSAPGSEGICTAAPGDADCPALQCGADTECSGYDRAALDLSCAGYGQCRREANCVLLSQPAGASCRDGTGTCTGAGSCAVPGKKVLAEGCAGDGDCSEGHCVQAGGVALCCDAACDGVCEQCGPDGHCSVAPAQDERCGAVSCPADNPCRDYEPGPANACHGFGECATGVDCPFTPRRSAGACECDAGGVCRLLLGETCEAASDCASGACIASASGASVCCATACGEGLSCSRDGSACIECEGTDVACEGPSAQRCVAGRRVSEQCENGCTPGVGCNALPGVGFACPRGECSAASVCQADADGVQRCCVRDCAAEGKVCAANGSCACAAGQVAGSTQCLLQAGEPCSGANTCQAGLSCVDGVCCDGGCGESCERCNLPGREGQCSYDAADTVQCGGDRECSARAQCQLRLGTRCSDDASCSTGNCEALVGVPGARVCCSQACAGAAPSCTSDGTRCVACAGNADCANGCNTAAGTCNPLRPLGQECTQPAQCQSQACVADSVTPNTRRCCAGCAAGQLCSAQGQCVNPPGGAGDACSAGRTCGGALTCVDGVCCQSACDRECQRCGAGGVCSMPTTDTVCSQQGCPTPRECQVSARPGQGQCEAFGRCAQCQTGPAPAGTGCSNSGSCDGRGGCVFYDFGTQCSVGGTTMHCCPSGSAMLGAHVADNVFKCVTLPGVSGAAFMDPDTQRNDMHACPSGAVMVGLRDDMNQLACQYPTPAVSSEFVDFGTQDGYPMHICSQGVMSGIRVDRNEFTCGS